ncbi:MAG: hypothetical protein JXA28_07535, partial [Bacteroidetes bacterium]|nr:hypothetical protein [Bacteroidota bacterium]
MRRLFLLPLLLFLLPACTEDVPPLTADGITVLADAQFYPTLQGSAWEYRVDTTGGSGLVTGAGSVRAAITGTFTDGTLLYAVQVNQVTLGGVSETDSLYIRHAEDGVRVSSPGLQQLSGIPPIP